MKHALLFACLLFSPLRSFAAPAFVNSGHAASGTANCAITLSVTSGNTLVFYLLSTTLSTNVLSVSDGNTNTYTSAVGPFTDAGKKQCASAGVDRSRRKTNAALVITGHVTLTTNFIGCVVYQFSGLAASSVVDQTATASFAATTAAVTGTTSTTTQASEILVGWFGAVPANTQPYTALGGYTIDTNGQGAGVGLTTMGEYLIVSSTGTYQATATTANTVTGGAAIVTLKAAGVGGVTRQRAMVIQR